MHEVTGKLSRLRPARSTALALAALLTLAAASSTTAIFTASEPGSGLEPVGGAELLIDLVQGQENLLWSSLAGSVELITVVGWPSTEGEHDLGGALVIERPAGGLAGVVEFGERPMSAEFDLGP